MLHHCRRALRGVVRTRLRRGPVARLFSSHATNSSAGDDTQGCEVSGRVVAVEGRLVMIAPDFSKDSTRVFRPGSIVKLSNGTSACLAFEAAGFNFALLLPEGVGDSGSVDTSTLTGADVHISRDELKITFDSSVAHGGSIVDCFGHSIGQVVEPDASGDEIVQVAFNPAPGQFDRQVIRDNIHTGVTSMDALTPFGKGQSMLVFGETGTGKSTIAADVLLSQHQFGKDIHCIYAATGLTDEGVGQIVDNVLNPIGRGGTLVASSVEDGDDGALFAALTACALGEFHRDNGKHAMVVLDEISGLQRLWDKGWAMAHKHIGRETTPPVEIGQLRSFYMPLLQRAAKLDEMKRGGGSMSLIAMVNTPPNPTDHPALAKVNSSGEEEQNDEQIIHNSTFRRQDLDALELSPLDVTRLNTLLDRGVTVDVRMLQKLGIRSQKLAGQKYMATAAAQAHPYYAAFQASKVHIEEMSSIADGHIRLSPSLLAAGVHPPLDPQHSLTRIGIGSRKEIRDHRSKAMQKVATRLRIDVTAALDAVRLNSSPEEVAHAKRQLSAWHAALSQDPLQPIPLHEQVVLLFVAAAYYDDPVVAQALQGGRNSLILRHMRSCSPQVCDVACTKLVTFSFILNVRLPCVPLLLLAPGRYSRDR